MKFLKKFNESLIRSYNKKQYDDYQIEKFWKVNETDIVEIFSDLIDDYDATIKINFLIQFPSKLINILKLDPEKCESYIESGLWPVIMLTIYHKEKDARKIENYVNEASAGLEEYTLDNIDGHEGDDSWEGFEDFEEEENIDTGDSDYTTTALFNLDINSTGKPKISHNISIKHIEEMLSNYQIDGHLSNGYKISIDKKFVNKIGMASVTYKKDHQKVYIIELEKTCDISINNIDSLVSDKNAILSFCKKISESSSIHNINNSLKIEQGTRGRNKILLRVVFYER